MVSRRFLAKRIGFAHIIYFYQKPCEALKSWQDWKVQNISLLYYITSMWTARLCSMLMQRFIQKPSPKNGRVNMDDPAMQNAIDLWESSKRKKFKLSFMNTTNWCWCADGRPNGPKRKRFWRLLQLSRADATQDDSLYGARKGGRLQSYLQIQVCMVEYTCEPA